MDNYYDDDGDENNNNNDGVSFEADNDGDDTTISETQSTQRGCKPR